MSRRSDEEGPARPTPPCRNYPGPEATSPRASCPPLDTAGGRRHPLTGNRQPGAPHRLREEAVYPGQRALPRVIGLDEAPPVPPQPLPSGGIPQKADEVPRERVGLIRNLEMAACLSVDPACRHRRRHDRDAHRHPLEHLVLHSATKP